MSQSVTDSNCRGEEKMSSSLQTEERIEKTLQVYSPSQLKRYQDGTISRYHERVRMTVRPEEEVQRAIENRPFADVAYRIDEIEQALSEDPSKFQDALAHSAENLLRTMWPMLEEEYLSFRVSFSLYEEDNPEEVQKLTAMIEKNRALGLLNQASRELPITLRNFSEVRGILRYMRKAKLLLPHTLLPETQLPWFLLTAPVWFVGGRTEINFKKGRGSSVIPDSFTRYMVDRLGTKRLGDWFQIWNRQARPFSDYEGDMIPDYLLDLIGQALQIFDYVVISTPYLHRVGKEWADAMWQPMIDPYLLAFNRELRSMFFFLGRWSNTGLFPLAAEMVANTMAYLKAHEGDVRNFSSYRWAVPPTSANKEIYVHGPELTALVEGSLKAFHNKKLFAWLTEGRQVPRLVATA